jgi:uncharacterized NAD(P)/FAD-binding protein YdhS
MGMTIRRCAAAFVGGGIALTAGLRGILHENAARGNPLEGMEIVAIEPRARLGVGTAWDTKDAFKLTNMEGPTLSVYGALDADCAAFDILHPHDLFEGARAEGRPLPYMSRKAVGDRLADFYREIAPIAAESRIRVRHVRAAATRILKVRDGFRIETSDGGRVEAGCVILGLGLLPIDRYPHLGGTPNYIGDPWAPGDVFAAIREDQRVAIAGMGPSGIDCALSLGERDMKYPVLMASSSGRLPAVRPRSVPAGGVGLIDGTLLREYGSKAPFTAAAVDFIIYGILERFGVTLDQLRACCALSQGSPREMLERTLESSDRPQPVFDALKAIDRLAPVIWQWSGKDGRARIKDKWAKVHAQLSYAIPPSHAASLLAQLNAGHLEVRGGLKGVVRAGTGFELQFTGAAAPRRVDVVINATGFEGPLDQVDNPLVRNLLADGLLTAAPWGGALIEFDTGEALDGDGRRVDGLFVAGGSLTRSAAYVVNSLLGTTEQAIRAGVACARRLHARSALAPGPAAERERWAFVI